jgi:membrane protein required for colicin V production
MTALDYLVLIVVLASVASGAAKGILRSVISVLSAVVGLVAAGYLYGYAGSVIEIFGPTPEAADLIGFAAVFLGVVIGGALLTWWLRRGLKGARLSWVDHLAGAGFGLARGWLICSAVYLALTAFPLRLGAVERAAFAPALLEGARVIAYLGSRQLREEFWKGYATVRRLWEQGTISGQAPLRGEPRK